MSLLKIAGRGDDGNAKAIQTDNNGIQKVIISSVLSSDQDTVSLGGLIAESLYRRESLIKRIFDSSPLRALTPTTSHIALNTTDRIRLEYLEIYISTSSGGFVVSPYDDDGAKKPLMSMKSNGTVDSYFNSATVSESNENSYFQKIPTQTGFKYALKKPIVCPLGVEIEIKNYA